MRKKDDGELRLVWLEAFVATAEKKSFSLGAKRLGEKQPNVSRYVDRLQTWMRKLLIAETHPVRLTDEGQAFLPVAKEIVAALVASRAQPPTIPPEKTEKRSAKDIRIERREGAA